MSYYSVLKEVDVVRGISGTFWVS